MPAIHSTVPSSLLLGRLPLAVREQVLQHCEVVQLEFGSVLYEPGQVVDHAYFPLTSFISLLTTLRGHQPLEMGLVGYEGMLGAELVLGMAAAPMQSVVQGAGSALRIVSAELQLLLASKLPLQRLLQRYLYVMLLQVTQNAACTHFHEIEPRLARWLLMTHDRAHADHFHLTHEFMADMLGVRRSGISIAANALQQRNLISYSRGEIQIIDRQGLEAASCECYGAMVVNYRTAFASADVAPLPLGPNLAPAA